MAPRANQRGGRQNPVDERFEREEETRTLQEVEERLAQMLTGQINALTEQINQRLDGMEANNRRQREHREPDPRQYEEEEGEHQFDNPFAERVPRRSPYANPNFNQQQRWDSNAGKELIEFTGTLGPDEFMDWIGITEDMLELKRIPEEMKVSLVATKFRGRAAAWWQQLKHNRSRQGKAKIDSWDKLKKHMRSSFLPYNYVRTLFQRIQNLKQGSRSIDEYTAEFYQLVSRNDLADSDEQLVSRYIGGLSLQFQDTLNLFDPVSVSEAHQRALHLEKQLGRKINNGWSRGNVSSSTLPRSPQTETTIGPPPRQHGGATAGGTGAGPVTRSHTVGISPRCFSCGEPGHRMAECPSKRTGKGLLVETETGDYTNYEEQDPVYDREGLAEEFLEGDKGPMLVLRRTCLTPRVTEGDEWLRNNIFRSTCTIGGKVCSIIIDPGSCENVVSQEAVTKLLLPTEQHPKPYRLSWLKEGTLISVSKRCLVSFSIGSSYRDKVWCDVVEMDACHLLLGRPWEFDVSAIHDGRKNTYAFMFENRKIVLVPTKDVAPRESPGSSSLLVIRQPVEKDVPNITNVRNYMIDGGDGRSRHLLAVVEDVPGNFVSFISRFSFSNLSIFCPLELSRYDMYESRLSTIMLSVVEESPDGGVLRKMVNFKGFKGMSDVITVGGKISDRGFMSKNAVINDYANNADIVACRKSFNEKPVIGIFAWNALVDRYAKWRILEDAMGVYQDMINTDLISRNKLDGASLMRGPWRKEPTPGVCRVLFGAASVFTARNFGWHATLDVFECNHEADVWHLANSRSNSIQPGENDAGKGGSTQMNDADEDEMKNDAEMKTYSKGSRLMMLISRLR